MFFTHVSLRFEVVAVTRWRARNGRSTKRLMVQETIEGIASNKELHEQLQQIMKGHRNVNRTPQQIETKLMAPRCLNNIPFSATALCPGTGTKSGRGLRLQCGTARRPEDSWQWLKLFNNVGEEYERDVNCASRSPCTPTPPNQLYSTSIWNKQTNKHTVI